MDSTPDDERLHDLEEEIDRARQQAQEHGTIPEDEDHPQRFYESGDEGKGEDDQAIAP